MTVGFSGDLSFLGVWMAKAWMALAIAEKSYKGLHPNNPDTHSLLAYFQQTRADAETGDILKDDASLNLSGKRLRRTVG